MPGLPKPQLPNGRAPAQSACSSSEACPSLASCKSAVITFFFFEARESCLHAIACMAAAAALSFVHLAGGSRPFIIPPKIMDEQGYKGTRSAPAAADMTTYW